MASVNLPPNFFGTILEVARQSQASTVLLLTTQLDDALEEKLRGTMPKLSNTMRDKLFSGYGPFSSFSVKIDVAHAMGFIGKEAHHDFNVIREIRNKFAHPRDKINFEADVIKGLLTRFTGYKKDKHTDAMSFFNKKVDEAWDALNPTMTLSEFLQSRFASEAPRTSPEKS